MKGVSIVEAEVLQALILKVEELQRTVTAAFAELSDAKKPYLTAQEVQELTGFGHNWLNEHKAEIGFMSIGKNVRFKRADVDEFMMSDYYKKAKLLNKMRGKSKAR